MDQEGVPDREGLHLYVITFLDATVFAAVINGHVVKAFVFGQPVPREDLHFNFVPETFLEKGESDTEGYSDSDCTIIDDDGASSS